MRFLLRMCEKCFVYTLNEKCKKCKIDTKSCHPAKFSPDDKYINYRIRDRYEQKN